MLFHSIPQETFELFNKCIGVSRFFYNQANVFVKKSIQEINMYRLKELEQEKQKGCIHKVQGKQCCGHRHSDTYDRVMTIPYIVRTSWEISSGCLKALNMTLRRKWASLF
jgi:UDP-2,3-diacylglucosamine pyrophosphatase LpxH